MVLERGQVWEGVESGERLTSSQIGYSAMHGAITLDVEDDEVFVDGERFVLVEDDSEEPEEEPPSTKDPSSNLQGVQKEAWELQERAFQNPGEIDPDEVIEYLTEKPLPPNAVGMVSSAAYNLVSRAGTTGEEFVDGLAKHLTRAPVNPVQVLRTLALIAEHHPGEVYRYKDEIISCIDVEESDRTYAGIKCCASVAEGKEDAFVDETPLFAALLDVNDQNIRDNAEYILSGIAENHPEEVLPAVNTVIESLQTGSPNANQTSFLGRVSREYPTAAVDHIDTLQEALEKTEGEKTLANLLGCLADIAEEYPDEVVISVDDVSSYLSHEDSYVRYNAVSLMEELSVAQPDVVRETVPELLELLEDFDPEVRLKSIYTLGQIREEQALKPLEEVREEDDYEKARDLAGQAIERIENGGSYKL